MKKIYIHFTSDMYSMLSITRPLLIPFGGPPFFYLFFDTQKMSINTFFVCQKMLMQVGIPFIYFLAT